MKIFAEQSLVDCLTNLFSELSLAGKNFYVVNLRQPVSCDFDTIIEIAKESVPAVMLGWHTPEAYIKSNPEQWFAAMGYSNVAFCRLPALKDELLSAFKEASIGHLPDPLAIALLTAKPVEDAIKVLKHDIFYARRNDYRMMQWEKMARAIFGNKNQAELILLVESVTNESVKYFKGPLAGQSFHDVCVDIEGTIFDSDDHLCSEVIVLAQEKANGGPITIWTGGDVYALTKKLRGAGIFYKVTSKRTMQNATVRIVIDDQPETVFKDEYDIGYQEYIQV